MISTWRIIPFRKWIVVMVSKSHLVDLDIGIYTCIHHEIKWDLTNEPLSKL